MRKASIAVRQSEAFGLAAFVTVLEALFGHRACRVRIPAVHAIRTARNGNS